VRGYKIQENFAPLIRRPPHSGVCGALSYATGVVHIPLSLTVEDTIVIILGSTITEKIAAKFSELSTKTGECRVHGVKFPVMFSENYSIFWLISDGLLKNKFLLKNSTFLLIHLQN